MDDLKIPQLSVQGGWVLVYDMLRVKVPWCPGSVHTDFCTLKKQLRNKLMIFSQIYGKNIGFDPSPWPIMAPYFHGSLFLWPGFSVHVTERAMILDGFWAQ